MRRAIAVLLGLGLVTSASAAASQPHLLSASARNRHIVVTYTLGDQAPSTIVVATRPATGAGGQFLDRNVRLREPLSATVRSNGAYRMRTRHTLRVGWYYVQVSATVLGLDCTPRRPCPIHWSNTRRVRVTRR
ncbi:MAG TPA: hypothetical protein VLU96_02715 [Gaiellaceae bacterium]|nr:hypothetical protein [Gaiellaceae bacterium]